MNLILVEFFLVVLSQLKIEPTHVGSTWHSFLILKVLYPRWWTCILLLFVPITLVDYISMMIFDKSKICLFDNLCHQLYLLSLNHISTIFMCSIYGGCSYLSDSMKLRPTLNSFFHNVFPIGLSFIPCDSIDCLNQWHILIYLTCFDFLVCRTPQLNDGARISVLGSSQLWLGLCLT